MKILAIETSCDETAIALLDVSGLLEKPDIQVLGNALLSQAHLHAQFGGVYPNLAKREHQKNLPILLEKTLAEAHVDAWRPQIDYIAVTSGPGLEPALWTGITFAEDLGKKWGKPVIPVNHMLGHIYSVLYQARDPLTLPALALLVSGGHTELVYVKTFGNYKIIGQTLDDAVGEAYDKVARMLDLAYPGGPEISRLAEQARNSQFSISNFQFPRPMIHSKDLNFSFSGLKTAVLYKLRDENPAPELVAKEFEDAVIDVLITKTRKALETLEVKTLIIAGGVSANKHLRKRFQELKDYRSLFPTPLLTTDNAIMIGLAAFIKVEQNPEILTSQSPIIAQGNLATSSVQ